MNNIMENDVPHIIPYGDILAWLNQGYSYVTVGYEYEGIEWYDEREKPTKEFLESKFEEYSAFNNARNIVEKRKLNYPSLNILADAIYHKEKFNDNSKMESWIAACDAVKQKYPKPQGNE